MNFEHIVESMWPKFIPMKNKISTYNSKNKSI